MVEKSTHNKQNQLSDRALIEALPKVKCKINKNLNELIGSVSLHVLEHGLSLRQHGKDAALLGFGASPFSVLPYISDALKNNVNKTQYLTPLGLPLLRSAIAAYYEREYQYEVNSDNVIVQKSLYVKTN